MPQRDPEFADGPRFGPAEEVNAETLIAAAMSEDFGTGVDVTSWSVLPEDCRGTVRFTARHDGVLAGLPVVERVVNHFDLAPDWRPLARDGDRLAPGQAIAHLTGPLRALLGLERISLNFLQRLSGIASLTAAFVEQVRGTRARILDTRKTTPGWRALEKYAVRCGGGVNHRSGLHDMVLIKDNHLAALAGLGDAIGRAVAAARAQAPVGMPVELEVDTLEQFDRALEVRPDIILIDNLGPEALREAVRRRDERAPGVELEASGGVNLRTVRALAASGVDRISVGALTHSAAALDIGLDFVEAGTA